MKRKIEAKVIMCRCNSSKKFFGVRVQKIDGDWLRTWAFPISEQAARNEGYMDERIHGSFDSTSEYPGCPHCKTHYFVVCGNCNKMSCWNGESVFTCEWCNTSGSVSEAADSFDIDGNNF